MKHPIRWMLIGLLAVPVLIVAVANGIAESPRELLPPDPGMLITLPDGRQQPLFDVLAHSNLTSEVIDREGRGAAEGMLSASSDEADEPVAGLDVDQASKALRTAARDRRPPETGDIYGLAEYALDQGDLDQALALFRSLPEEHPRYGRAQRRIGWDIYTKGLDDPNRGLAFVNRSIRDDPTEGNAWQDAIRVYAATIGFPVN